MGSMSPSQVAARPRRFDAGDLAEVTALAERVAPGLRVAPLEGTGVTVSLEALELGPLRLTEAVWPAGGRITALGERYVVACATAGVGQHVHGGGCFDVVPGRWASLGSPDLPLASDLPVGYRGRGVWIERAALERQAALVHGGPERRKPAPVRIDLTRGLGLTLEPMIDLLWMAGRQAGEHGVLIASLCDSLLTVLAAEHPTEVRTPAPPSAATVRRVEAYIEAHAREPIVLADLVAVAGVSVRTLQISFQKSRGLSPMAFLQQRRLACARADLLSAPPGTTVATVARRLGFVAAGRFSVAYRRRFGESPSQTLARAPR